MPGIPQQFTLSVTPDQFVKVCSDSELFELDILLSKEFRRRDLSEESIMTPQTGGPSTLGTIPEHKNIRGAGYYS